MTYEYYEKKRPKLKKDMGGLLKYIRPELETLKKLLAEKSS